MIDPAIFVAALRPASFRGVPFAVTSSRKVFGRRTAVHEYPFRDVIWVEDLGRKGREISITGFLVTDSLIYGGGAVLNQQLQLIDAAETKGPGTLVHPTLGTLNVSCLSCSIDESFDTLGSLAIELTFLEAGEKVFPFQASATQPLVATAATALDTSAGGDADNDGGPMLAGGPPQTNLAATATGSWTQQLQLAARDATGIVNLASQLIGPFGRFFNGGNQGGLGVTIVSIYSGATTVDELIIIAANAQGALLDAIDQVLAVAGNLGLGASSNSFGDLATAAQAALAALLACAADPADAIRLLIALATGQPTGVAALSAIGGVVSAIFRRAALAALCRAAATYQPSSSDDAVTILGEVTDALDDEITLAGDAGDDATFNALRGVRVAIIQDLTARGADLSATVDVASPEPMPSLVLAQRLYRDASRAPELEIEAVPIHPLFMPTDFQALAA